MVEDVGALLMKNCYLQKFIPDYSKSLHRFPTCYGTHASVGNVPYVYQYRKVSNELVNLRTFETF